MSREQELERLLAEYRAAKMQTLDTLDECMRLPDNRMAEMWRSVAPILKAAVEGTVERRAEWNQRQLERLVFEKVAASVLGPEWEKNLEKLVTP